MRKFAAFLTIVFICITTGCTENIRARRWGGTGHVEVKPGHKVIGATWKEANLWVITRPMYEGEAPEQVIMSESSSFGVVEGHVVLQERDSQEKAKVNGR